MNHHKEAMTKCPLHQTENRLPETATARVQSETGNQEALMHNKKEKEGVVRTVRRKKNRVCDEYYILYTPLTRDIILPFSHFLSPRV